MISVHKRPVPRPTFLLGAFAVLAWLALFASGLLVETIEHRYALAPRAVAKQLGMELPSLPLVAHPEPPLPTWKNAYAFFVALTCFTPINLALLALVAGLAGGCASNIAIETLPLDRRAQLEKRHPVRVVSLQEPPVSAAIRGFVVYLCVIAGIYIVVDDPFGNPTPAQYIRLAGAISIMAFVVGYDSSRLQDWLSAIPGPGGRGSKENSGSNVPAPQPNPPEQLAAQNGHGIPETEAMMAAREGIDQ